MSSFPGFLEKPCCTRLQNWALSRTMELSSTHCPGPGPLLCNWPSLALFSEHTERKGILGFLPSGTHKCSQIAEVKCSRHAWWSHLCRSSLSSHVVSPNSYQMPELTSKAVPAEEGTPPLQDLHHGNFQDLAQG